MKPQNLNLKSQHSGIALSDRSVNNPGDPVDVLCNLYEKALNSKGPVIKSKFAVDPVNDYAEEVFNIKVSCDDPKHPIDEFYDSILMELNTRRPFVKPSRPLDMVNTLAETSVAQNMPSAQSAQKLNTLLTEIKGSFVSAIGSTNAKDPVNDLVEKQSTLKPKHTLEEVTNLIKKSLGAGFRDIKPFFAMDGCNDFVADQFGMERPSVKTLNQVEDKLMQATNELAYKLTHGSDAYNSKAKEIDQLKEERRKLQDNLNELDK